MPTSSVQACQSLFVIATLPPSPFLFIYFPLLPPFPSFLISECFCTSCDQNKVGITSPLSCGHCTLCLSPNNWSTKFLCLTYQCVHKIAPQHLQELVSPDDPPCSLQSSSLSIQSISWFWENTNEKCSGAWSFCNAAPTLWNRLPDKLYREKDIASFWQQLKSCLFSTL